MKEKINQIKQNGYVFLKDKTWTEFKFTLNNTVLKNLWFNINTVDSKGFSLFKNVKPFFGNSFDIDWLWQFFTFELGSRKFLWVYNSNVIVTPTSTEQNLSIFELTIDLDKTLSLKKDSKKNPGHIERNPFAFFKLRTDWTIDTIKETHRHTGGTIVFPGLWSILWPLAYMVNSQMTPWEEQYDNVNSINKTLDLPSAQAKLEDILSKLVGVELKRVTFMEKWADFTLWFPCFKDSKWSIFLLWYEGDTVSLIKIYDPLMWTTWNKWAKFDDYEDISVSWNFIFWKTLDNSSGDKRMILNWYPLDTNIKIRNHPRHSFVTLKNCDEMKLYSTKFETDKILAGKIKIDLSGESRWIPYESNYYLSLSEWSVVSSATDHHTGWFADMIIQWHEIIDCHYNAIDNDWKLFWSVRIAPNAAFGIWQPYYDWKLLSKITLKENWIDKKYIIISCRDVVYDKNDDWVRGIVDLMDEKDFNAKMATINFDWMRQWNSKIPRKNFDQKSVLKKSVNIKKLLSNKP